MSPSLNFNKCVKCEKPPNEISNFSVVFESQIPNIISPQKDVWYSHNNFSGVWVKYLLNLEALIWAESGVRTLMLQIYGDAGAAAWMGGYTMWYAPWYFLFFHICVADDLNLKNMISSNQCSVPLQSTKISMPRRYRSKNGIIIWIQREQFLKLVMLSTARQINK